MIISTTLFRFHVGLSNSPSGRAWETALTIVKTQNVSKKKPALFLSSRIQDDNLFANKVIIKELKSAEVLVFS